MQNLAWQVVPKLSYQVDRSQWFRKYKMKGLLFVLLATFVVYVHSIDNPLTPKCPIPDRDDYVPMLRHPCKCSTYFVCLTEPPIPMTCPDGLQFDEVKQVCDFAWRVRCRPKPECPAS